MFDTNEPDRLWMIRSQAFVLWLLLLLLLLPLFLVAVSFWMLFSPPAFFECPFGCWRQIFGFRDLSSVWSSSEAKESGEKRQSADNPLSGDQPK